MQGRWPKQTVQALISALRSGRVTIPVSSFSLARAVGGLPESLTSALVRWFAAGVSVDAVIEMLDAIEQQTALAAGASIELVWTGPEAADTSSRDTSVVVRELFSTATSRVLVAGFAFVDGRNLFEGLARRMDEQPDLLVTFFVNIARDHNRDARVPEAIVSEWSRNFRQRQWPGTRLPTVFYDPRALCDDPALRASLHAKTVVVDGRFALVTSANFTGHAHTRNVELGLRIEDVNLALRIEEQFDRLRSLGHVLRVAAI